MKAWDTNVLIRHLTEDDAKQLQIARAELAKSERRGEAIWLSLVVIIETARVLSAYGLNKNQILKAIEAVAEKLSERLGGSWRWEEDTAVCESRGGLARVAYDASFVTIEVSLPRGFRVMRGRLERKIEESFDRYFGRS